MNRSSIDWRGGRVSFWDMDGVDLEADLPKQARWELKEDLAQVEYGDDIQLDVGWYPSFSEDGEFLVVVVVVAEGTWGEYLFEERTRTAKGLLQTLERAISVAVAAGQRK
jgi:hypothetical protein